MHHVRDVALLAHLAVHLERERALRRVAAARDGHDGGGGRRGVEALRGVPRHALRLRLRLEVAAREVEAHAVAEHVRQRLRLRDVGAAGLQRDHELHFVVQVGRARWIADVATRRDDRVGRLQEERRRRFVDARAHLLRVFGEVAADAVDAVHGEATAAIDGDGSLRRGGNGVFHGALRRPSAGTRCPLRGPSGCRGSAARRRIRFPATGRSGRTRSRPT